MVKCLSDSLMFVPALDLKQCLKARGIMIILHGSSVLFAYSHNLFVYSPGCIPPQFCTIGNWSPCRRKEKGYFIFLTICRQRCMIFYKSTYLFYHPMVQKQFITQSQLTKKKVSQCHTQHYKNVVLGKRRKQLTGKFQQVSCTLKGTMNGCFDPKSQHTSSIIPCSPVHKTTEFMYVRNKLTYVRDSEVQMLKQVIRTRQKHYTQTSISD